MTASPIPPTSRLARLAAILMLSLMSTLLTPSAAHAAVYQYDLQSFQSVSGRHLCIDVASLTGNMFMNPCNSASTSQRFEHGEVNGRAVYASVRFPGYAITAASLTQNALLHLARTTGSIYQGYTYDALGNRGYNIYPEAANSLTMTVPSLTVGAPLRLTGSYACVCNGSQSWHMPVVAY